MRNHEKVGKMLLISFKKAWTYLINLNFLGKNNTQGENRREGNNSDRE